MSALANATENASPPSSPHFPLTQPPPYDCPGEAQIRPRKRARLSPPAVPGSATPLHQCPCIAQASASIKFTEQNRESPFTYLDENQSPVLEATTSSAAPQFFRSPIFNATSPQIPPHKSANAISSLIEEQPSTQDYKIAPNQHQTLLSPSLEPLPDHLFTEKLDAPTGPLTSANLQTLNISLGRQDHSTRVDSDVRFQHSSTEKSQRSTAPLEADMADTVHATRTLLQRNRIHIYSEAAELRGGKILEKATRILDQKRKSVMKVPDAQEIVTTIRYFANKGEHTLVRELWKDLVKKNRLVSVQELRADGKEHTPEEEVEETKWLERAWRNDDHVWAKFEGNVLESALPRLVKTGDKLLDALLPGIERITKPRPDIAYGIGFEGFSFTHQEILHQCSAKINGDQFLSFFAVEAKCGEHSIEEAENQCGPTGGSMVKVKRSFTHQVNASKIVHKPSRTKPALTAASQSSEQESSPGLHLTDDQASIADKSSQQESASSTAETLVDAAAQRDSPFPPLPAANPPDHADLDSIAFTLALTPQLANMNVHYAEVWADGHIEYQMQRVRPYLLTRADEIIALHHDIDNILDWGCGRRKRAILQGCDSLAAALETARASQKRQEEAGNKKRKVDE